MDPTIVAAIITGIFGIVIVIFNILLLRLLGQTHLLINSRMDELLALTRAASRAEGVAAGEQSQRDRSAEAQ